MNNQAAFIFTNDDYINTTTIFGGIKKTIISKDFRGGRVSNIFGATELDFTNADIAGVAVLDISQCFGEVKIAVPGDWWIESDTTQVFATVEDKRLNVMNTYDSKKILVLRGTSFFGVVEVLSSL
ncbi:cell wall-active antibiotics response protein [Mucilaginibacter sp. BJC16-A38]|uniref:cell wall-active antibiotics response protein n=1 Tax=Mucilaginibacter phenanthrenivorans TaxID=1234842 RepID=UPI002157DA50|nr:cell wall-active antibiotics response protein [Mucilaginibacter phenanthrenivorans]MCR8560008.1 cell wall-active antibiotics response protein [Mucilaginibacter phenanthrenivorans]